MGLFHGLKSSSREWLRYGPKPSANGSLGSFFSLGSSSSSSSPFSSSFAVAPYPVTPQSLAIG